jgi:hypothetical protein
MVGRAGTAVNDTRERLRGRFARLKFVDTGWKSN